MKRKKKPFLRGKWFIVTMTAGLTILAGIIAHNIMGGETRVHRRIPHIYSVSDAAFGRAMGLALGPSITEGNQVAALLNGDEIFPAMLEAIRSAQKTITAETYIYWAGDIGEKFAVALSERARAGVKVHVLIDWSGSDKMDERYVAMMKKAGVAFQKFRPLRWYSLGRVNKRTHRKLLVVDGRIGFTGGVGIADIWTGHAQDPAHWRDSHYRVEGPVVAEMQAAFMDNWIETTGEVLHGPEYFPPLSPAGSMPAQLFYSSPTAGSGARWGHLLAAGAEIYEYGPTMYHCKAFIVDELLVSVGSTNWDPRSFGLNDEANLNIYDADFARRQVEVFRQDLSKSHRVTPAEWRARPFREKFMERLSALAGPEL